jgi:hypothetical protein
MSDVPPESLLNAKKESGYHSKEQTRYGGSGRVNDSDATATHPPADDPAWLATTPSTLTDTSQLPDTHLTIHPTATTITVEASKPEHRAGTPLTRETAFPTGPTSTAWTPTLAMALVADADTEPSTPPDPHLPESWPIRAAAHRAPAT